MYTLHIHLHSHLYFLVFDWHSFQLFCGYLVSQDIKIYKNNRQYSRITAKNTTLNSDDYTTVATHCQNQEHNCWHLHLQYRD